jgi:hypothetical protein
MAPTTEWQTINSGEYDWYVFHFDYVDDTNEPIEIKMVAEPYASALMTVRNQAQVDEWVRDGTQLHFGCTTMVNEDLNLDGNPDYQQWAGKLRESGDYYLVVEHARDVTVPAFYQFEINGRNITLPAMTPVEEPMAEAEIEAPETMAAAAPVSETDATIEFLGTGPDFAMVPNGEWTELDSGEYHWYKITYDESDDWTEPMTIQLYSEPLDSAILTVRNGHQAELWRQDGTHNHFGCCVRPYYTSKVDDEDDDAEEDSLIEETEHLATATWSAKLDESGEFYLVVEHAKNSSEPAFYRFDIMGQGFDF